MGGRRQHLLPHLEEGRLRGLAARSGRVGGGLGGGRRYPDWVALFDQELSARPWADVGGAWVPRLVAGSMAAGTHGLIRAAHAARALTGRATPGRRCELAAGLAYWAAKYRALEGAPAPSGALTVSQAPRGGAEPPCRRTRPRPHS